MSHSEYEERFVPGRRPAFALRDFDFADIRNYPPWLYEGILVPNLREDALAGQVVKVLEASIDGCPLHLADATARGRR
jgi:hypothetical protein